MKVSILKHGDKVINVTDKSIMVEHATGEVTIYSYLIDNQERRIQINKIINICFEDEYIGCNETIEDAFEILRF